MNKFEKLKSELLSDVKILKVYKEHSNQFEIAQALIKARMAAKMTQAEVASKMEISQAQIARMESGQHTPNFLSIKKYAKAINRKIDLQICP